MEKIRILAFLQLLAVPVFSQSQQLQDQWGEFGPYGPCSRSCGTGVAMRTRKCITLRTDGGHNCVGSAKSFQICNTIECPVGSRDFREEQCSQFDRIYVQGKRHTWVPYYGAKPCELNCVTREQNVVYRHRPKVVDGTPCHVGRSDICVDGECKLVSSMTQGGVSSPGETVVQPEPTPAPEPQPTEPETYEYRVNTYGECSATCGGGTQHRTVECWLQDPVNSRMVDESFCIVQHLPRPESQQVCNAHSCNAKYSFSVFGECSVTCGGGQQRREVYCEGAGGERLADVACQTLTKPHSVRVCRRPACRILSTWHVTAYGLCSRSCGGGVRERQVACLDSNLKPNPVARCGISHRPVVVEACNSQPCHEAQVVPSLQNPEMHESTATGFVPYVPEVPATSRPNIGQNPNNRENVAACTRSYHGCCPDGRTSATGPANRGCSQHDCMNSRFGCCLDGVTPAGGFGRAGCPVQQTIVHSSEPTPSSPRSTCSLPRAEGSCDSWRRRFYFNTNTGRCTEFWWGGCLGNANNFASLGECQIACEVAATS
ncbi:papilin b, proteoglycan-like sulfated glycoprotein [Stigmatopora nigra]